MNKPYFPYFLFVVYENDPGGGMDDYAGVFDDVGQAREAGTGAAADSGNNDLIATSAQIATIGAGGDLKVIFEMDKDGEWGEP